MCKITVPAIFILLFLLIFYPTVAMPPSPEVLQKMIENNELQNFIQLYKEAQEKGIDRVAFHAPKIRVPSAAAADTMKILMILIDFADYPYTAGGVAATPEMFDSLLFSKNKNPSGSMTEFYLEDSYGKLYVDADIYGWFHASHPPVYYSGGCNNGWGDPPNSFDLCEEAIALADPVVDFSQYDNDHDGIVEGIVIVHAGVGAEESGNTCDLWSFMSAFYESHDGVMLQNFSFCPEEEVGAGISPIGVFCHEFGHVLGCPDLYDYDHSSNGCGSWSLMANGVWLGGGRNPCHLDAYNKVLLGWVDPIEVTVNLKDVSIPAVINHPVIYRLWADGQIGPEYFLVANRQKSGYDFKLPGEGLLIWHVDETQWGNDNEWHPLVMLEQADGNFSLQTANSQGDASDPYPGTAQVTHFDDKTIPDSKAYDSSRTQVAVWNISNSGPVMTANLDVRWSQPYFALDSSRFVDDNEDGFFDSGESVKYYFRIRNDWMTAHNATVTMTSNDPNVVFTNPSVSFPFILGDSNFTFDPMQPIEFIVPELVNPFLDSFFVTVSSDEGEFVKTFAMEQEVGHTRILLVDDDRGSDYETIYTEDLTKKRIPCHIWTKLFMGSPSGGELKKYPVVIWFTGDSTDNYLQTDDITALKDYLDNGGHLFLTGQGLAGELRDEDSLFLDNYLHARFGRNYFYFQHDGIAGSPIGDQFKVRYISGANQALYESQEIIPIDGAVPAFKLRYGTHYSALSYDGAYRLVYFNWGYEALLNSSETYAHRDTVMMRILLFLDAWEQLPCFDGDGDGYGDPGHPENICAVDNCPDVYNPDQTDSNGDGVGDACSGTFACGDVNSDYALNLKDIVYIINYLYLGGPAPAVMNLADVDGNSLVNIKDIRYLILFLYRDGPAPACP